MKLQYPSYHKLNSEGAIRARIATRFPIKEAAEHHWREFLKEKAALKSWRARKKMHDRLWRELQAPLKREIAMAITITRSLKTRLDSGMFAGQEQFYKPRLDVYMAYRSVLEKLLIKMEQMRDELGETPAQIARQLELPNKGTHWVDWVPASKKFHVSELFESVPTKPKAKRKVPFERRIPKILRSVEGEPLSLFEETRQRLLVRTRKEYDQWQVEQEVRGEADEGCKLTLRRIKQAIEWIENAKEGTALPTTWHGLYEFEELPPLTRLERADGKKLK